MNFLLQMLNMLYILYILHMLYLSAQHMSISVLDTTRVSIFLILTYAGRVICKRNSDVTVMQQLCHNSITVMSL